MRSWINAEQRKRSREKRKKRYGSCSFEDQAQKAKRGEQEEAIERSRESREKGERRLREIARAGACRSREAHIQTCKLPLTHQDGRMNAMTRHLKNSTTPKAYSISGIVLSMQKVDLLARDLRLNTSLQTLHMSRKKVNDTAGVEIAKMLETNKVLLKVEMEGNLL